MPSSYTTSKGRELAIASLGTGTSFEISYTDINTRNDLRKKSSNPKGFTQLGSEVFFFAETSSNNLGYESTSRGLWKTDGTEGNKELIKDGLRYGPTKEDVAVLNGKLILGILGELWISDGTADGSQILKDIDPNGNSHATGLREMNGKVYFFANDGTHGTELWETDGTAEGTVMLKDISNATRSSDPSY